jgi:sulfur carrier protein ThiS adenylyltransferase
LIDVLSKVAFETVMIEQHSPTVHKALKKARVAIAGLGGLGSNVATMLTRVGVGHLLLVDFDIVERGCGHNLGLTRYIQTLSVL